MDHSKGGEYDKTTMAVKNVRIVNHLSCEYDNLIVNTKDIKKFNDQSEGSDSSLGSISSADVADLRPLFSGLHRYRFDLVNFISD